MDAKIPTTTTIQRRMIRMRHINNLSLLQRMLGLPVSAAKHSDCLRYGPGVLHVAARARFTNDGDGDRNGDPQRSEKPRPNALTRFSAAGSRWRRWIPRLSPGNRCSRQPKVPQSWDVRQGDRGEEGIRTWRRNQGTWARHLTPPCSGRVP